MNESELKSVCHEAKVVFKGWEKHPEYPSDYLMCVEPTHWCTECNRPCEVKLKADDQFAQSVMPVTTVQFLDRFDTYDEPMPFVDQQLDEKIGEAIGRIEEFRSKEARQLRFWFWLWYIITFKWLKITWKGG
jgi:hypothetical protein